MVNCWAQSLGDCGEESSKEHIVSAALWEGSEIHVEGFKWCKTEAKTVSIASLTSKILCKHHNNALSPLDAAAAQAFATLRRATALANERGQATKRRWPVLRLEIEEPWLLERWFLKTALNICVVNPGGERWRSTGGRLDDVPEDLVRMAFGRSRIEKPRGLYTVAMLGEQVPFRDAVEFAPLYYGREGMIAGLFTFRGLRFVCHMEPHELPSPFVLPVPHQARWASGTLQYHLQKLNWNIGKKLSHCVHLLWHLDPAV